MKTNLTIDEKLILVENKEAITASMKVLSMVIERHTDKLIMEPTEDGTTGRLLVLKSKIDGMREMVREYEQLIAKIIRS